MKTATNKTRSILAGLLLISLCCSIFLSNFETVFALEDQMRYTVTIQETEHGSLSFAENANYEDVYKDNVDKETVDIPMNIPTDNSAIQTSSYAFSVDENGNIIQNETGDNANYTVPDQIIDPSCKKITKGDNVILNVLPDENYVVENIYVLNEKGKAINYAFKDNKISFIMPRSSVSVKVLFTNKLSDITPDDSIADNYTYIISNLNKDYVNFTKWETVNLIKVKQTVVESTQFNEKNLDKTIDNFNNYNLYDSFLNFKSTDCKIYDVDDNSDYYIAFVDTMHNDESEVTDYCVANYNNNGEVLENNYYDYNTGILYIKKEYVTKLDVNDESTFDKICNTQIQLLNVFDKNDELDHKVQLIINDDYNILNNESSIINNDQYDNIINIKLLTNSTEVENIDVNIKINDIYLSTFKLNETVDTNSFSFNSITNVLSIYSNMTISINSIELETINNENNNIDFIDTALAVSLTTDFSDRAINHPKLQLLEGSLDNISNTHALDTSKFTYKLDNQPWNNSDNTYYITYPDGNNIYHEHQSTRFFTGNTTCAIENNGTAVYASNDANINRTARDLFLKAILGSDNTWQNNNNYTYMTETGPHTTSDLSNGMTCYAYSIYVNNYIMNLSNKAKLQIKCINNGDNSYRDIALLECMHISDSITTLNNNGITSSVNNKKPVYFKIIGVNNNLVTWAIIANREGNGQAACGVFQSTLPTTYIKMEKIYDKKNITNNNTTKDFYSLAGTEYTFTNTKNSNNKVTFISDTDGKFKVKGTNNEVAEIPLGTYRLTETKSSKNYNLSKTANNVNYVDLDLNTVKSKEDPYNIKIEFNNNDDISKLMKDYPILLTINGIKKVDNGNIPSDTTIKFEVYYSNKPFFENDGNFKYNISKKSNIKCEYSFSTKNDTRVEKVATAVANYNNDSNINNKLIFTINKSNIQDYMSTSTDKAQLRGPLGYYLLVEKEITGKNTNSVILDYNKGYPTLYTTELTTATAKRVNNQTYERPTESKKWTYNKTTSGKLNYTSTTTTITNNTIIFNVSNTKALHISAQKSYNTESDPIFNTTDQRDLFYSSFINNKFNPNYSLENAKYYIYQYINGSTTASTIASGDSTANGIIAWTLKNDGISQGYTLSKYNNVENAQINGILKGTKLYFAEAIPSTGTNNDNSYSEKIINENSHITSEASFKQNVNVVKLALNKVAKVVNGSYLHNGTSYSTALNGSTTKVTTNSMQVTNQNGVFIKYNDACSTDRALYFSGVEFKIEYNPKCTSNDDSMDNIYLNHIYNVKITPKNINDVSQGTTVNISNGNTAINYFTNNKGASKTNSGFSQGTATIAEFDKMPIGKYRITETAGAYKITNNSINTSERQPKSSYVYEQYINDNKQVSTRIANFTNSAIENPVSLQLSKLSKEETHRADYTGVEYTIYYKPLSDQELVTNAYTDNTDTDISNPTNEDKTLLTTPINAHGYGYKEVGKFTIKGIITKENANDVFYKNVGILTEVKNGYNTHNNNICTDINNITSSNYTDYNTFTYNSGKYIIYETKIPNDAHYDFSNIMYKRVITSSNTSSNNSIKLITDNNEKLDPTPETFSILKTTNNKQETLKGTIFKIDFLPGTANLEKTAYQSFTTVGQTHYTLYFGINENTTTDKYTLNLIPDNFLTSTQLSTYGITVPNNYDAIRDDILKGNKYGTSMHHIGNSTPNKNNVVSFYQGAILITEVKSASNHEINTEFEIKNGNNPPYKLGNMVILNAKYTGDLKTYIQAYLPNTSERWKTIVDYTKDNAVNTDIELIKDNPIGDPFSFRKVDYNGNGLNVEFRLTEYLSKNTNVKNHEYNFKTTDGYIDSTTNNAFSKTGGKPLIKDRYYVLTETSNNTGTLSINIPRFKHIEGNNILDDLQAAANSDPNMAKAIEALIINDDVVNSLIDPPTPKISSKVRVNSTGSNIIPITKSKTTVRVTDTISYENLAIGNKYQLHGIAMDVTENPPKPMKDANGNVIIKHGTIFDPKTSVASNYEMFVNGTTNLAYEFAVDESTFAGKTINFYTYLTISPDDDLTNGKIKINGVECIPYNYTSYIGNLTDLSNYSYDEQQAIKALDLNKKENNKAKYSVICNNEDEVIRDANKYNVNQTLYTLKVSTSAYDTHTETKTAFVQERTIQSPNNPTEHITYKYIAIRDKITIKSNGQASGKYYIQNFVYDVTGNITDGPCLYNGTKDLYNITFNNGICIVDIPTIEVELTPEDIKKVVICNKVFDANGKLLYEHTDRTDLYQQLSISGNIKTTLTNNNSTSTDSSMKHLIKLPVKNSDNSDTSTDISLTDAIEFTGKSLPPSESYEIYAYLVEKESNTVVASTIDGFYVSQSDTIQNISNEYFTNIYTGNPDTRVYTRYINYKFKIDSNGKITKMYNILRDTHSENSYVSETVKNSDFSVLGKTLVSVVIVYANKNYMPYGGIYGRSQLNEKFSEYQIFDKHPSYYSRIELFKHFDLESNSQSVYIPKIDTYAYNTNTNSKYIDKNSNSVNITDEITCVGLPKPALSDMPAKTYYAFGVIVNKNSNKVIATASETFNVGYNDNEKQVSMKFNNIHIKNILSSSNPLDTYYDNTNEFIIYEYIFKDSTKVPTNINAGNNYSDHSFIYDESVLLVHKDIKDKDQTLITTDLKTIASYSNNGSKLVPVSDTLGKVTDKSTATLIKNNGYRIIGYLVDTADNKVIDKQSRTFTATSNNSTTSGIFRHTEDIVFDNNSFDLIKGDIYVDFNFNSYIAKGGDVSALKNHNLVVYEYLYKDTAGISWGPVEVGKTFKELTDNASVSRLISKHYDKNDANQRVQLPEIRTTAVSTDNSTKVVFAGTSVNISDTVKYSNLIANDEYRLCGYIIDKSTHKIIARASNKFTASAANGNFTLAFSNVNASGVSGKELVIYEYLYSGGNTFTWPQNSVGSTFSAANIINDASYSRYLTEHVDDNDKDQTLYVPEIYTNAVSTEFGGHLLPADKTTTIKDTITYKKLISDDWYRINGYLVDKSNNKIIAVQTKTFQPDNTKSKTPVNGSCSINYSINTTNMGNHTFVIYEYVYTGNGAVSHGNNTVGKTFSDPANAARLVGKHYDRNDSKQTVYVPLVSTTANNNKINDHLILANNSAEIVDTISYNKLVKNNTYRYYGFIVNKENNKILTTKTGTFKASGTEIDTVNHIVDSGTVKVTFSNIDLRNYEGKTFVIYEYVFNGSAGVRVTIGANSTFDESKIAKDTLIAKHYAPNDFDQQIGTVKIGTQAINTVTNNNLVLANGQASIKDTVSYTNVLSNTGYHILGYLVDLDDANKVIAKKSVKFNSKTTTTKSYVNGTVEVPFTFDASNLAGHRLVVYEYLYYSQANVSWGSIKVGESFHELTEDNDSAAYKRLIAIHKNDEDEKQNVYVVKVGTTASNNVDNIKLVLADTNANIVDSVHCQNLIQGQSYRLCGYLINKRTNIVVRKITKTFTASSNTTFTNMSVVKATNSYTIVDGYVNLNFDINASKYENTDLVVYEYLYMNTTNVDWSSIIEEQTNASVLNSINSKDRLIGIHNERDDKGQTVYVPKARTTASVVNNNQRVTPDENGSQKVRPDASVELKDTISYNNLLSKSPYTVFGYLVDTNNTPNDTSDDKLVASQCKTFTSNSTNTVGGSNGNVDLNFTFDARKFAGKSVVIYEYIYTGNVNANAMTYKPNVGDKFVLANVPTKITNNTGIGVLIAKHADSTDRKQTIVVTMPIEFIKKDYDNNILAGTTLRFSKVNNVDMNNLANIKPDDIKNNSLTKLAEWVTTTDFYRYEDVEEGIYVIEEIHASKSHAIVVPVYITVRKDAANNNMFKAYYTGTNEELGRHNNNTQYQSIILYDPELTKLPTAGSTGTLLYTVFGMMLMMGSYYMLKRKKLFEF